MRETSEGITSVCKGDLDSKTIKFSPALPPVPSASTGSKANISTNHKSTNSSCIVIIENHGCSDSSSSRAWTSLSEAETVLHAHSNNHAWRYMRSTWRPSRQWGLRVPQVTGGVRSYQIPCRVRQGTHVTGDMGGAWGLTEVHGADSASFSTWSTHVLHAQ